MNPPALLINPRGVIAAEIAGLLRPARKTKPLWAKQLRSEQTVETLEGPIRAYAGNYLCRGIQGEHWPQEPDKLFEKYTDSGETDRDGWQRFEPKPETQAVLAAQIDKPFLVEALWGTLKGKPGDFVVQSVTDNADIWIVDRTVFEATYEVL